jgi:hypothetical protein
MGAIGAVLLVACANIANLMLVRADARRQELAMRVALGAGPARIARELLVESLVLGAAGGGLGLLLAYVGLQGLIAIGPSDLPRLQEIAVHPPVLRYMMRRLLSSLPVFFCVVTIVFFVVRVLPGDPAQAALGDYASREAVEALRTRLGLEAPLAVQYAHFLGDLARGDLGTSMINGASIRDSVVTTSVHCATCERGAALGVLLGVPSALRPAVHHNWPADQLLRLVSLIGCP